MFLSSRVQKMLPSPTLAMSARATKLKSEGLDIINLGVGEPDFDTISTAKLGGIAAINSGKTKYTAVDGTNELKAAIVQKFKNENNIEFASPNITVGCGAKHVIFNALLATINAGDEVIIPTPYWVSYPEMVSLFDGSPKIVDTKFENRFKLTAEEFSMAITPKTKWLILNSPSNPSGEVYSRAELLQIADVMRKNPHVHVLSDDIYEHITFDGTKFETLAAIAPDLQQRILTINGVSKSYAMTGWRIGYGASHNQDLIKAMGKIQSQSTTNPSSVSQEAARTGLLGGNEEIITMRNEFQKRRDYVYGRLMAISGINAHKPAGAFYIFFSVQNFIGKNFNDEKAESSEKITNLLLERALVSCVHGEAFGISGYIRISYATSMQNLTIAMDRMEEFFSSLK